MTNALRWISGILIALFIAATIGLSAWVWKESNVTVGGGLLSLDQRTVQNVTCTGACEDVVFASDQEPGKIYFSHQSSSTDQSCTPVTLWANQIREDQIGVNGYLLYQGGQVNLRPLTVDIAALDGRIIPYKLTDYVPTWFEHPFPAVFDIRLKDVGDWNLIDSTSFTATDADHVVVTSEFVDDRGTVTLVDGCPVETVTTYTLYQAANLSGPGDPLTYLVSVGRLPDATAKDAFTPVSIFEKFFSEEEMAGDSVHIDVTDGETTFGFDLVK